MARLKISSKAISASASKIKERRVFREIEKISKDKRVLPISFLILYKWQDGYEVRGRIGKDVLSLECKSKKEALVFIEDNI